MMEMTMEITRMTMTTIKNDYESRDEDLNS